MVSVVINNNGLLRNLPVGLISRNFGETLDPLSGSLLTKEIIHFLRDLIDIDNLEPKLETKDFKSFIYNEFNPGAGNEIIAWFLQLSSKKDSLLDFSILISGGIYCPRCLDLSGLGANDSLLHGLLGKLSNPEKVEELNLSSNQITEIKGLDNLVNLKLLDLNDNQITEIKGLEKLVRLNHIELCYNQITEIKGLDNLVKLRELQLFHNQITEIKGLDRLLNLDTLDLNDNQITEIKGLDNLVNLNYLDLSHNQIAEIKGLDKLPILANLYLEENRISIIECIEHLSELTLMNLRSAIININDPFDDLIFLLLDTELHTELDEMDRFPALKIFNFNK
jgi:Leucine-rich repeat (LRR) protein